MNGTDAKKYSSNLTVIGYFSNLPRIIFKKSSESNTTEKYLRKFQVVILVTFPSIQFSVKQNDDTILKAELPFTTVIPKEIYQMNMIIQITKSLSRIFIVN